MTDHPSASRKLLLGVALSLSVVLALALLVLSYERAPGTNRDIAFAARPAPPPGPGLSYRSAEPASDAVRDAVFADSFAEARSKSWFGVTPPRFIRDPDGFLSGSVKLGLRHVNVGERETGTVSDALDFLGAVSRKHRVGLQIQAGDQTYMLQAGAIDPKLRNQVDSWALALRFMDRSWLTFAAWSQPTN